CSLASLPSPYTVEACDFAPSARLTSRDAAGPRDPGRVAGPESAGHAGPSAGTRRNRHTDRASGGDPVSGSTEKLHERVRALRARAAIQRWEIRQRGHAAGSWFALERLFALSRRAWILS